MVDEGGLLGDVGDHAAGRALDLPDGGGGPRHQDEEHAPRHRVGGQVLLGDAVLPVAAAAVDDRDVVGLGERADPAGEPARHPHQVGVVQLLLGVAVQAPHHTRNPPGLCPSEK